MAPLKIPFSEFKQIAVKAYNATRDLIPVDYPSVSEIDAILDSEEFKTQDIFKMDIFKFFAMFELFGFRSDQLWHEHHPGHRYPSRDNVALYLLTPLNGDDAVELHCGIWGPDTDEQTKEDRQSAFEYMQSIMLDPEIYEIEGAPVYSTPASDEGAAKPAGTAV